MGYVNYCKITSQCVVLIRQAHMYLICTSPPAKAGQWLGHSSAEATTRGRCPQRGSEAHREGGSRPRSRTVCDLAVRPIVLLPPGVQIEYRQWAHRPPLFR